jgi:hypothetical protein
MPTRLTQRVCSHACRQRAWRRRHIPPTPLAREFCVACAKRLTATERPSRRFCDSLCRNRAYRARLALRRKPFLDPTNTRIVLPGRGPVCLEYASRGYIPDLPFSATEVYTFGITEPRTELDWDIDRARAIIAARPRNPLRLDPEWLQTWLSERTSVTAEHLDHIPSHRSDRHAWNPGRDHGVHTRPTT